MRRVAIIGIILAGSAFSQTAVFPGGNVTDSQLKIQVNGVQTSLTAPLSAGALSASVLNCTSIVGNTIATIEQEIMQVSGCSGNTMSLTSRGFDNTSAQAHSTGAAVSLYVDAWHHNALRVEMEAIEAASTSANTAANIVKRDGSGNFAAGTITAGLTGNVTGNLTGNVTGNVTGNAATATALAALGTSCSAGSYARGVDVTINATGCTALSTAAQTSKGTATTVYHGNATGDGSFGSVVNADIATGTIDLTSKVTGLLPHANVAATAVTPGAYTFASITVAADGSITAASSGTPGTVSVVGAGSLTSTDCVTGGGTTTLQTPSSNCKVDASGNIKVNSVAIGGTPPLITGASILGITETTGQACVAGADCLVADSTSHKLHLYENSTTDEGGLVAANKTNTAASSMTLDLTAITAANAFKVPLIAGGTAGADGVLVYDTTGKNTHIRANGADGIAGAFTSTPTTGHCIQATVAAGNVVLVDSGSSNCGGGGSISWNNISNPIGNLALAMAADTSTFTYNGATGAAVDMFKLLDTASNTGTGSLLRVSTAASSAAHPVEFDNNGNGVQMSTVGVLAKLGTGSISADALNGTAFSGTNGNLVSFGAANIPADAGVVAANVVTATGTLTSTDCVTGAGTKTLQTPASNCTIDASGNIKLNSVSAGATPPAITGSGILGLGETTAQACVAGADCLVANSTSHTMHLYENSTTDEGGLLAGNKANVAGSSMTLDLSAISGANAFKVPVIAGATAGADGVVVYDSTGKNTHIRANGVDGIAAAFTSTPTTGHCIQATVVAGNVILSDSGTSNCSAGSSFAWSNITNPAGNLALTMAANTSTFTYNATTGAAVDLFKLTDTASNTGTGSLLRVSTGASSAAHPVEFDNNGNGILMSATGALAKVGTGSISADALNGTAFSGTSGHVVSFGAANIPADSGLVVANVVQASSPGAGVAHFAGATQTLTSSAVVAADTDTSIAHTGVDVNTSYQVTATHLAAPLPIAQGGSNGTDVADNGGVVYSNATGYKILAHTTTANLPLLSGNAVLPVWAAITYPTSANSGGVPYFSSPNVMGSTATLTNHGVMVGEGAGNPPVAITADSTTTHALFATAGDPAFRAMAAGDLPSNVRARAIGVTFDGGGVALTAGLVKYLAIPFGCTIAASTISADLGTATVQTWKIGTGTAIPTVANTISTSGISLSTGTSLHTSNASDFTSTTVTANDLFGFDLSSVASATQVNFILECDQ